MEILLDFDGTCATHIYPRLGIGEDIGAQSVLRELVREGHKLILFTVRDSRDGGLLEAVNWFSKNDIELYGIQESPTQKSWTDSPKAHGQLIIDDTALGIPLKIPLRGAPFVDWERVESLLRIKNIL